MSEGPDERTVLQKHAAIYDDPIRVARGEPMRSTGREDDWDGHRWIWAVAGDREGWVPGDLPDPISGNVPDGTATARYDYSAVELDVAVGDVVTSLRCSHGWCWCRARDDREGWVPERVLSASSR